MRTSLVAATCASVLALGVVACGSGYPDPATPVVEEEEAQPMPSGGGPEADPKAPEAEDDDDVKPKGDPTDDIGDPRDQKHDEEPMRTIPGTVPPVTPRKS